MMQASGYHVAVLAPRYVFTDRLPAPPPRWPLLSTIQRTGQRTVGVIP